MTDSIFNEMLEFFQNVFPISNTSRWKDSNTPGKKVHKKVLRYFLIIPRLQRLYKSSHTVKEMIWHATGKCRELGLQHVVGDIDNIQSASVVMYEREFFYADVSGQGYKVCPTCNEDTPSVRVLSKTAYVGHRRFLKADPTTGSYDVEAIRRARPEEITAAE
ncbi:protein kinase, ATP binding site-containing protein, partial [Tanacetum coccineum]